MPQIIQEYRDGLNEKNIKEKYPWLFDEKVDFNFAIIGEDSNGLIIYQAEWNSGEFLGNQWIQGFFKGIFSGNIWRGGHFIGGEFKGNQWITGEFNDGSFIGSWTTGTFNKGTFSGTWNEGLWNDGTFVSGTWIKGQFLSGTFNGTWMDGLFSNGSFSGTWLNGRFLGGSFKGDWKMGTFCNGTFEGNWDDGIFLNGTIISANWKTGKFNGGIIYDIIWEKGMIESVSDPGIIPSPIYTLDDKYKKLRDCRDNLLNLSDWITSYISKENIAISYSLMTVEQRRWTPQQIGEYLFWCQTLRDIPSVIGDAALGGYSMDQINIYNESIFPRCPIDLMLTRLPVDDGKLV